MLVIENNHNSTLILTISFLHAILSSPAITASSRWVWASRPSTPSGLVTTSFGTQHALCVVSAVNYWWTWFTSGRKASCTVDAIMETVRSHAVEDVTRWVGIIHILKTILDALNSLITIYFHSIVVRCCFFVLLSLSLPFWACWRYLIQFSWFLSTADLQ